MSFTARTRICISAFSFLIASFCNSYRPGITAAVKELKCITVFTVSEEPLGQKSTLLLLTYPWVWQNKWIEMNGALMCFISSLQLSQALKAFSPPGSLGSPTRKEQLQHMNYICYISCSLLIIIFIIWYQYESYELFINRLTLVVVCSDVGVIL